MAVPAPHLPYFDLLLEGRARGAAASGALSRFVHWGYWENPASADGTTADFQAAMERLNDLVVGAAALADGQSVLDAGCGFGGTLATVDARHARMRLTGLNIDGRQLEVARAAVKARPGNSLDFVEGDACALPFPDASFDRVMAVECIFHFPSRFAFLREAARVLKPGGMLALSDFVPRRPGEKPGLLGRLLGNEVSRGYGVLGSGWPEGGYDAMADRCGLTVDADLDITVNTLPTYPKMQSLLAEGGLDGRALRLRWSTFVLEQASRLGMVRYRVVSFKKA